MFPFWDGAASAFGRGVTSTLEEEFSAGETHTASSRVLVSLVAFRRRRLPFPNLLSAAFRARTSECNQDSPCYIDFNNRGKER